MIVFADSSALVTAYADTEPDVLPMHALVVVSALARVEVPSALWRKAGLGEMVASDVARLVSEFERDWHGGRGSPRRFERIHLGVPLLERAAALTGTHGLRSLDAVQLACALAARDAESECRTMVVLDERLRRAAATEGFDILPA